MEFGRFTGISNEQYHTCEGWSKTNLVEGRRSMRKMSWLKEHRPKKKKKAFDLGTAAHAAILEGIKIYVVPPDDVLSKDGAKRGNKYKEWADAQGDKIILKKDDHEAVLRMFDAVYNDKYASALLSGGEPEVSYINDIDGIILKCRPDYEHLHSGVVVDLKTCSDASREGFGKDAYKLHYHWSPFITKTVIESLGGKMEAYIFLCVEVDPPHEIGIYEAADFESVWSDKWSFETALILDCYSIAEQEMEPVLKKLRWCQEHNVWFGLQQEPEYLRLPYRARK